MDGTTITAEAATTPEPSTPLQSGAGVHLDAFGTLIYMNELLRERLGYQEADIVGKPFLDIVHASEQEPTARWVKSRATSKQESRLLRREGGVLWVDLLFAGGEDGLVRIEVREASARKAAETEATLISFYESSPLLMGVVDLPADDQDIHHVYDNPATERFFGLSRGQTAGRSAREMGVPDEVIQTWVGRYRKSQREGRPTRFEYCHPLPTGDVWLSTVVSPIGEMESGRTRFSYVTEDVSERRSAEEALRRSEDRFRRFFELAVVGAAQADPHTNRYVDVNAKLCELTGYPREELLEITCLELTHPEDAVVTQSWLDKLKSGEVEEYVLQKRYLRKDGHTIWVNVSVSLTRTTDGAPLHFVSIVQDITEQKAAEQALRQSKDRLRELNDDLEARVAVRTADLEAANREMEGFTYSVSHDFRAPLRSIASTSRIIQEDFGHLLPQEALALLDRQAASAKKLASLVDDLLKFSRVGRQDMTPRQVDLTAMALDVFRVALADGCPPGLEVEVQEGMTALADPILLQLALENLIENALKFSRCRGRIVVGRRADGTFFVSDQGVGFEDQYAEKLFEPFQRLVGERDFPGTGIGLANVRRIVERHGGRVRAESQGLGRGATFLFTFPEPGVVGSGSRSGNFDS